MFEETHYYLFGLTYVSFGSYGYCADNPVKFVDIHGEVIGNPNDPKVQKLQAAMMKTSTGTKIWRSMERSKRTINIYFHSMKDKTLDQLWNRLIDVFSILSLQRKKAKEKEYTKGDMRKKHLMNNIRQRKNTLIYQKKQS